MNTLVYITLSRFIVAGVMMTIEAILRDSEGHIQAAVSIQFKCLLMTFEI